MAAARFVGHEQDARPGATQAERHLALAEDRHQRAADRADAQRRERNDDELEAVGKLIRHALAAADAERKQKSRGALDAVEQLLPRQRGVAPVTRLDDGELARHLVCVFSQKLVKPQARGSIRLEHLAVGFRAGAPPV